MNTANTPFGLDATVELVRRYGHQDPKTLCDSIYQELVRFRGEADPHDDITLVALKVV